MKILSKEFLDLKHEDGKDMCVLKIKYTYYRIPWEILIRDVEHIREDTEAIEYIIQQLKEQVQKNYKEHKEFEQKKKEINSKRKRKAL